MKRKNLFTLLLLFLVGLTYSHVKAQSWQIYDASVHPTATENATGDTLDLSSISDASPGVGLVSEIIDDELIPGNKLLKYFHPDGKTMYRHYFSDTYSDSSLTILARIKGDVDSTSYDRLFDIQWRNGNAGTRDELRISAVDSTIELEKADVSVKVDMDLFGWHTYRIVVEGDMATVYVDENPVPVISGVSTSTTTDTYLKIGDGTGDAIGGYLDWCILDTNGAYIPGEGADLPSELFVDGIKSPLWMVYDGSILPENTADGGPLDLDISNQADNSPGAGMVKEIIDDDLIVGNKVLKYLHPDGKLTFRHYFDDAYSDSAFTIMARIKAEADTLYDRAFDIRWDNANAGTRDELRIWAQDSTLELEKADVSVKLDMDLNSWHTYRIQVSGDTSRVYINEDPTPVIEGVTTASTTNKYMKVGDGSGDAIGGYLDWLTLDVTGGYAPEEGAPVPAELYIDGTPLPVTPNWKVFDASLLPEETENAGGDTLDISNLADNSPGLSMVKEIIDDADIVGNKLFKYLQPEGKLTFRHYFDSEYSDSAFTIMARIKAEADTTYDRAFDIRWDNANAGTRDELRIWAQDSTIELEKAGVEIKLDIDLFDWHTFRIVVEGDLTEIYLDESSEPVLSGTTTASTTNKYLKVGDGSGDAIGGYLDWLTLDVTGAYKPGEGAAIPEELFVDTQPLPEIPKWLVYDASMLPLVTENAAGDTLDISNVSQGSPGLDFVEEIIDDPDVPGNKLLKYLQPNGTTMYRYYFNEDYTDTAYTIVARIRGENDPAYDRTFDLQWRNGNAGTRDELRMWGADSTIELEKAGVEAKSAYDLYEWHTIRIAVDGNQATVYMDEWSEPILTGVSTESTTDKYIKIGDGSGDAIGGYLDWIILDVNGAYAPGEGLPFPEDLKVDRNVPPIIQQWIVYEGNVLPDSTEGAGNDTLDISSLSSDSPGPGFVEEIIDDTDIVNNKVLKFLMPLGNRMYRYYFPDNFTSGNFTWVFRTKQEWDADTTYSRGLDFQWRNGDGAARDELRIDGWDKTLELEKSDVTLPVDLDLFQWHTYRIAVNGAETKVYVDENPEPVLTGTSGESSSDKYFKFGDAGSGINGGYVDWMAIDLSGAYAPGEGLPLPDNVFVDDYTVDVDDLNTLPTVYALEQNYPNPFNPTTAIQFQLPKNGDVKVNVYNILGQLVSTLVNEELKAGYHRVDFNARNLASGIYFYTINAGDFVDTKKMILLK